MRLLPREHQFYSLFVDVATANVAAAEELRKLFEAPPERRKIHIETIKRLEHQADDITHEIANRIDKTFITPLDREDIHRLAAALDDLMDAMDSTARRAEIYRVGTPHEDVLLLVALIGKVAAALAEGVSRMRKGGVLPFCVEAKRIEEEGDAIYHTALGRLFEHEKDPIELIKWKGIYDALEFTLDQADDVANTLESITLKNG